MKLPLILALGAYLCLSTLMAELAETVGQMVLFHSLLMVIAAAWWFTGWCAAAARHARRHPALPPRTDGVIEAAFQNSALRTPRSPLTK